MRLGQPLEGRGDERGADSGDSGKREGIGITGHFEIRPASEEDAPLILSFIKELAEYERLSHEVVATEGDLREWLFGERRAAEVVIGHHEGLPAGFALFFHSFSTFLGRPGIYLEDLYVKLEFRGMGLGRALLAYVAKLAKERGYGRLEWSVLDWNEPAIKLYQSIGAAPMDEWTVYRVTGDALDELAVGEPDVRKG